MLRQGSNLICTVLHIHMLGSSKKDVKNKNQCLLNSGSHAFIIPLLSGLFQGQPWELGGLGSRGRGQKSWRGEFIHLSQSGAGVVSRVVCKNQDWRFWVTFWNPSISILHLSQKDIIIIIPFIRQREKIDFEPASNGIWWPARECNRDLYRPTMLRFWSTSSTIGNWGSRHGSRKWIPPKGRRLQRLLHHGAQCLLYRVSFFKGSDSRGLRTDCKGDWNVGARGRLGFLTFYCWKDDAKKSKQKKLRKSSQSTLKD